MAQVMIVWPAPVYVGCVRCGDEVPEEVAIYQQCKGCGKTCGICQPCARVLGRTFVRDAMAWHLQRKHPDLALTKAVRQDLARPDRSRRWGERFEI